MSANAVLSPTMTATSSPSMSFTSGAINAASVSTTTIASTGSTSTTSSTTSLTGTSPAVGATTSATGSTSSSSSITGTSGSTNATLVQATLHASATAGIGAPPGLHIHAVQQEFVPVLVSKRSATWRYLQRVHQGGMVMYNTAILSENDLRKGYSTEDKVQRRTLQYFLLGTSLATILDVPNLADYLKALHVVVQEYDYFTASESRSKMNFFRNSSRRILDGKSLEETGEYSLLEVRNLPFTLDYVITFTSLCDMIAQVYEKFSGQDQFWTVTNLEMFQKIDGRFKKILSTVSRELETMAREVLLEELNAMDPLGASTNDDWDL